MEFVELARRIATRLRDIPPFWEGKKSIVEMRDAGARHWRQMEWIGFYFQFLCERRLSPIMHIPGPRYGRVQFDGLFGVPWDFKAHAINTRSHGIIVNDSRAISDAIGDYGAVGLLLALGEAQYNDEARSFQAWHGELKGEISDYERRRIARGAWSRRRKVAFALKQLWFVRIDDETLVKTGSFQENFRNAGGAPRKEKVLLDLKTIAEQAIQTVVVGK